MSAPGESGPATGATDPTAQGGPGVAPEAATEHALAGEVGVMSGRLGEIAKRTRGLETVSRTGFTAVTGAVGEVGAKVDALGNDLGPRLDSVVERVDAASDHIGARVDAGADHVGRRVVAGTAHVGERVDALAELIADRLPERPKPLTAEEAREQMLGMMLRDQAAMQDRDARFRASTKAAAAGAPMPVDGFAVPRAAESYPRQPEPRGLFGLRTLARVLGRNGFLSALSPANLGVFDFRRRGKSYLPAGSSIDAPRDYAFNHHPAVGNASRRPRHHAKARAAKDEVIADLAIADADAAEERRIRFGNPKK